MTFLKNVWYVAANAGELDAGLVSRKICNEQIVMFRTQAGEVAALQDRCPHRFVPLSMGTRVGDTLQCGYHGLRFDSDGVCVDMPNDRDNSILKPCVKAYPAVQRYGVVWLWMGQPELADPAEIPDFSFITDTGKYAVGQGYSHVQGNYQLYADNLLDLSHIDYLHPGVHDSPVFVGNTNEVRVEGETVWSMLWRHHYKPGQGRKTQWGITDDDVEGQGHSRWDAPGVILVFAAFWQHGKSIEEGFETPSAHLLTPETEYTTHYFWAVGRNYALGQEEQTRQSIASTKRVFETQDSPMVGAQQAAMGSSTDFLEQKPIILKADAAGVMARRLMKRKLQAETKGRGATVIAAE